MEISKCKNLPGEAKRCADDEEINEFIDMIFITKLVQYDVVDFSIYDKKPV